MNRFLVKVKSGEDNKLRMFCKIIFKSDLMNLYIVETKNSIDFMRNLSCIQSITYDYNGTIEV
ncbi:hypothetical protein ACFHWD_03420 [Clostridium sp. MT-14]|uniref:hypothetical protein n=1 Tax=Clostridium sp. MT-14 TaxID=3348360 RepID=UPI0035F4E335